MTLVEGTMKTPNWGLWSGCQTEAAMVWCLPRGKCRHTTPMRTGTENTLIPPRAWESGKNSRSDTTVATRPRDITTQTPTPSWQGTTQPPMPSWRGSLPSTVGVTTASGSLGEVLQTNGMGVTCGSSTTEEGPTHSTLIVSWVEGRVTKIHKGKLPSICKRTWQLAAIFSPVTQ